MNDDYIIRARRIEPDETGLRPGPPDCMAPNCGKPTSRKSRKPFCTKHITCMPYVQGIDTERE